MILFAGAMPVEDRHCVIVQRKTPDPLNVLRRRCLVLSKHDLLGSCQYITNGHDRQFTGACPRVVVAAKQVGKPLVGVDLSWLHRAEAVKLIEVEFSGLEDGCNLVITDEVVFRQDLAWCVDRLDTGERAKRHRAGRASAKGASWPNSSNA